MATPLPNERSQVREATDELIALLQTLNWANVEDPAYLKELALIVMHLSSLIYKPHEKDENLDDAQTILNNILIQPLAVRHQEASLLSATRDFSPATPQSQLALIATGFLEHPDATANLICELQLLSQELQ